MLAIKVDTTSAYHSDAVNDVSEAEVHISPPLPYATITDYASDV